jgi:hypothetical protein
VQPLDVRETSTAGSLRRMARRESIVPWAALFLLAWVAFVVSGCSNPLPAETERCTGRASPLGSEAVVRALRKHGFSVRSSTTSEDCKGLAVFNADEAPGFAISNTDALGGSPGDEGTLYCLLRQGPIWGKKLEFNGNAKPSSPIFSGKKAEASFTNLECKLYPNGSNADDRVSAFRQAMQELAGTA